MRVPKKKPPTLAVAPEPNKRLLALWQKLEPKMRERLARLAGTSPGSLRQYAEGRRRVNPELAAQLEKSIKLMGYVPINRTQLNDTCKRCEYARRCLRLDEVKR